MTLVNIISPSVLASLFLELSNNRNHTHLQSREQQQRNMNSETKTQILAHKMRHKNTKRSAARAANGMAFHKTADEWQRLTHFSVGRSRSSSQQSAACHCTPSSELPSWSPALHRWVHTDVGELGQHEVMLGLHAQLNHDGVWTTCLQHLDVLQGWPGGPSASRACWSPPSTTLRPCVRVPWSWCSTSPGYRRSAAGRPAPHQVRCTGQTLRRGAGSNQTRREKTVRTNGKPQKSKLDNELNKLQETRSSMRSFFERHQTHIRKPTSSRAMPHVSSAGNARDKTPRGYARRCNKARHHGHATHSENKTFTQTRAKWGTRIRDSPLARDENKDPPHTSSMDGKRHLAQSNQEAFSERKTTVEHLTQHCRSLPVTYLLLQVQSFCHFINIVSMSVLVSRCPSFVQGRHQACGASRQITGRSALLLFARTACGDVQPRASDQGDVPAVRPPNGTSGHLGFERLLQSVYECWMWRMVRVATFRTWSDGLQVAPKHASLHESPKLLHGVFCDRSEFPQRQLLWIFFMLNHVCHGRTWCIDCWFVALSASWPLR